MNSSTDTLSKSLSNSTPNSFKDLVVAFPNQNIFYTNGGYFSFLSQYGIKRKIKKTYEVDININLLNREAYNNLFYSICNTFNINPRIIHTSDKGDLKDDTLYKRANNLQDKDKDYLYESLSQLGLKFETINNKTLIILEKEELIEESIIDEKGNYKIGLPLEYMRNHLGTFMGFIDKDTELRPLKRYLIQKEKGGEIFPVYSCITDYDIPLKIYVGLCDENSNIIYSPQIKGELAKIGEGN